MRQRTTGQGENQLGVGAEQAASVVVVVLLLAVLALLALMRMTRVILVLGRLARHHACNAHALE